MEDGNDNKENKWPHLTPIQVDAAEKANAKLVKVRALKKLSGNSKWTLVQEVFQEIMAAHICKDPENRPVMKSMLDELKREIELRYETDPELKTLLLECIPASLKSVRENWLTKDGWEEAVWSKIKSVGLFTNEKRAQLIQALWYRGMSKSDNAAKVWLTLSGDYSEKAVETDRTSNIFREINEIIHKKKNEQ